MTRKPGSYNPCVTATIIQHKEVATIHHHATLDEKEQFIAEAEASGEGVVVGREKERKP